MARALDENYISSVRLGLAYLNFHYVPSRKYIPHLRHFIDGDLPEKIRRLCHSRHHIAFQRITKAPEVVEIQAKDFHLYESHVELLYAIQTFRFPLGRDSAQRDHVVQRFVEFHAFYER